MKSKYAVEFNNVSKKYKLKKTKSSTTKNGVFYALKDINFKVEAGEVVGILGTNGSGKSTLSMILAGISTPDEGEIKVQGEQALIAIKSGLKNQLTGAENIELKGTLLGFNRKKIQEITQSVIEFSELGEFINQPVKTYSSGMKARLGFSISINMNPDIIIIDEALSVGDKAFTEKCLNKMEELKNSGKTIFYVSHSINEIKNYCTKALWIENGFFKSYGEVKEVAKDYVEYVNNYKKLTDKERKKIKADAFNRRIVEQEDKKSIFRIWKNKLQILSRS